MNIISSKLNPSPVKHLVVTLTCLFLSTAAVAFDPVEPEDKISYQAQADDWKEQDVETPDKVNSDDLQAFKVEDPNQRFHYFIERGSLKTGDDLVTRFVLVIRSTQGAVNSSYEGLRCGYRQYKVYAYGDGERLTPSPGADWQEIDRRKSDYRATLYDDLVCNLLTGHANPPEAVFKAMRKGRQVDTPFVDEGG